MIDRLHTGLLGTPARSLASIFGSLYLGSLQVSPAVKEVFQALLLAL